MRPLKRWFLVVMAVVLGVLVLGFALPERRRLPVEGARFTDWNEKSFWFEPWGASGVHKGIDIFAKLGTPALSPTDGFIVFSGEIPMGGKVVLLFASRWRVHYLAHLSRIDRSFGPVLAGSRVGAVGDSGNAQGKPPHLHYSIVTVFPYPWRWSKETQGWKKMFFLDPDRWLKSP